MNIPIGNFQSLQDKKAKEKQYDQFLALQKKLQSEYAKANALAFKDGNLPPRSAQIGEFKSVEEQTQDVFLQKKKLRENILKIFKFDEDVRKAIELFDPMEYLPFNTYFDKFYKEDIEGVKFLTPDSFYSLWNIWKDKYIRRIKESENLVSIDEKAFRLQLQQLANKLKVEVNRRNMSPEWILKIDEALLNQDADTLADLEAKILIKKRRGQQQPEEKEMSFPVTPSGEGMKSKRGRKPSKHLQMTGRGIDVMPETKFLTFGKFLIDKPKLYSSKPQLALKYPSKASIKEFPNQMITNDLAKILKNIIEEGKVVFKDINELNEKEVKLIHNVLDKAKLSEHFGLQGFVDKKIEEETKKFELLRGQVLSGNNSPQLLKEMKTMILKFMADNRMPKNEGNQILLELNSLI